MPDDRIGSAEDRHSAKLGVALSRRHGCSPVPPANSAHSDKTRAELTGVEPVTPCLQSGGAASLSIVGPTSYERAYWEPRGRAFIAAVSCCGFAVGAELRVQRLPATVPAGQSRFRTVQGVLAA